ncbi:hypothetical protein ZIOFF_040284 [Zingiber officinale]|uniref:Uncharacterized protein n=1 Tax=Zingiber officinale TaxID=94328 RepID=A0A8J5KXV3_ZINOF|nr:hypothetical protein ZIOFF_040284 [Zingiber officinale]
MDRRVANSEWDRLRPRRAGSNRQPEKITTRRRLSYYFSEMLQALVVPDRSYRAESAVVVAASYPSGRFMKLKAVALSSCEAEFMAATTAACHALWLRSLASELTGVKPKPVTLFVDNKSAITLMKNPVFHGRSKHIDTRFHFIRECIEKGQIVVEFVNTGEQRANALTKALPGVKLAAMRQLLGIRDLQSCPD